MPTTNCTCGCQTSASCYSCNIISIYRGDDTDAMGRSITVTVTTEDDWTGYKARFQLGRVYKDYEDVSSKTFNISLSASDTAKLQLGRIDGYLKFIDANDKVITEDTVIQFDVKEMQVRNTGL